MFVCHGRERPCGNTLGATGVSPVFRPALAGRQWHPGDPATHTAGTAVAHAHTVYPSPCAIRPAEVMLEGRSNLPCYRTFRVDDDLLTTVPPADDLRRLILPTASRSLAGDIVRRPRRRRVLVPVVLLAATAASTFWAGATHWDPILAIFLEDAGSLFAPGRMQQGLLYMAALLCILLAHEMGHFLTARRCRVPASLPFFLPMPMLPFGTLGAVIAMQGSRADRRQIFEIGVTGPLAGLLLALPILLFGVLKLDAAVPPDNGFRFHSPLLLSLAIEWLRPDYPTPDFLCLNQFNPLLMAGWVGILVTGLNMLPVSQLDGGHVSYALLGRHAHTFARTLLIAGIVLIVVFEGYMWVLMLVVVILLGVDHPPTADDRVPLAGWQQVIGWLAMTLPILCIPAQGISVPF